MNLIDKYDIVSVIIAASAVAVLYTGVSWILIPTFLYTMLRYYKDASNIAKMITGHLCLNIDYSDQNVLDFLKTTWLSDYIYAVSLILMVFVLFQLGYLIWVGILIPYIIIHLILGTHDMLFVIGVLSIEKENDE